MMTDPAPSITKIASKQTYYTIRLLADRARVNDAYRIYGYFRWVDDILDSDSISTCERQAFLERQRSLLDSCYRGEFPADANRLEKMLVELVRSDTAKNSGLQVYLRNMMQVMVFDTARRGSLVSESDLNMYTFWLASAVSEAIHYCIGHGEHSARDEARYLAVSAAHISHMLRDTFDDLQAGYYNIPREVLEANHMSAEDVSHPAYRAWVKSRVDLAREYFKAGKTSLAHVSSLRFRLAVITYSARFEWLLDTIEREDYLLRPAYNERRSAATGLRMLGLVLSSLLHLREAKAPVSPLLPRLSVKP